MSYPIPINETERLAALRRLKIIGSPRTPDFDAVLALALELTGCRAGLIGLMERDRQWCVSEIDIGLADLPRDMALGNHTLMQTAPLVVEDLSRDARFRDHPMVKDRGAIFYAGIALAAVTGEHIGTLCLTDQSPRVAEPQIYDVLRVLGRIIEGMLEARALTDAARTTARTAETREQEMWRKTRLLEQAERMAGVGSWELDVEGQVFAISEQGLRLNGLAKGDVLTLADLRSRMEPTLRDHATALLKRCIETGEGYEYSGKSVTAQGIARWTHVVAEADRRDGKVVRIFGTVRSRTKEHLVEENLWQAAHHDVLTNAPNRHYWSRRLDEAFVRSQADRTALTILMFDLDGFKEINDTRGHTAGDEVLREVSRRLAEALPAGAFRARLGGDEFAVLVEGALSNQDRDHLVRRLLDAMRTPIVVDGAPLQISGTVGSATSPDDAASAADLMRNADIALYQAKRTNRSSFVAYTCEIGGLFDQKHSAIDIVTIAIHENRLVPLYQPKIDLRTGAVIGFEAVCRIETATGAISTSAKIESALAASVRIGATMLDLVTADIAAWSAQGLAPRRIALNLTGADFADGTLAGRIIGKLAALGIPPAALEIELAEKTIRGPAASMIDSALHALEGAGVAISLDDFGIGYGSLSRLRDAPVTSIKLDRSFVTNLDRSSDNSIIVKSIVDLAHDLSIRVVAVGIETMDQAEFVRALGCDEAQGSLFAPPISRAKTRATLSRMSLAADPALVASCLRRPVVQPVHRTVFG